MLTERVWKYPLITSLRERLRERTSGEIPSMKEEHPLIGLLHDAQRLFRRKVFGGRGLLG